MWLQTLRASSVKVGDRIMAFVFEHNDVHINCLYRSSCASQSNKLVDYVKVIYFHKFVCGFTA